MRLLFVIPHFFQGSDAEATNRSRRPAARQERRNALAATLSALQQTFGAGIYGLDHFRHAAWQAAPPTRHALDIVVCTTGESHLLDEMPELRPLFRHHPSEAEPERLGFECHKLLAAARGRYDYYAYLEDDIVLNDPLFFVKRRLFDRLFAPDALLQPNRYELRSGGVMQKLYVDYHLAPARTAGYQNLAEAPRLTLPFLDETITLERSAYPSAGCFFLDAEQLARWARAPAFLDGDISYLSALDSAATLSVMKTFRIYKPVLDQAWFLEVLHASPRWIGGAARQTRLIPHPEGLS
jgi:hypothetical protein